ncbi:MAG: hypothetical protein PUC63_07280 [Clostridiales bacterium]|nr:hypothetical protein [Clostridiales bacterium]
MPDKKCISCGAALTADDIGCHKKLVCRGDSEYMCVPCLAKHFGTTESKLRSLIEEYRAYGCVLFPPKE